jgi:hypothetical protein
MPRDGDTMKTVYCAFHCRRNPLFRPSAIVVGWVIAQLLGQWIDTGSLMGTCGDGTLAWRCP